MSTDKVEHNKLEPPTPVKLPFDARIKNNKKKQNLCDFTAFWIFGLANNFAYVIMLSAAQDIMSKHSTPERSSVNGTEPPVCEEKLDRNHDSCSGMPLGSVLLADVLPLFVVKCAWPFIMHRMSFGFQHLIAVLLQTISYLIVAFSDSIFTSLLGVVFASLGSGIGEVCYLALASHYSKHMISSWSSGTGGAGLVGALVYAALTEPHLLHLTPQVTLLTMLVVPAVFFVAYFALLTPAPTIHPIMKLTSPKTWIVLKIEKKTEQIVTTISAKNSFASTNTTTDEDSTCDKNNQYKELKESCTSVDMSASIDMAPNSFKDRFFLMTPNLKYMIPLAVVYFAQYLISQGLAEFTIFDCGHGFGLDVKAQYRWYQVISQLGVFITRSSVSFFQLPVFLLILLPFLECANAAAFIFDSFYHYIPHLWIGFILMFLQGLIAGSSYVNSLYRIHKEVHPSVKEFSLAITAAWNALGIAAAGILSIPMHDYFCSRYAAAS